jgi:NAD(P)-dependent dehydrogenase (short-subunit alcohol dehydrogenase family)
LAAEGAAVAVVARTETQWDDRLPGTIGDTVAAIEQAGGRAVAIRADLLERVDIPRLVDEARAALGPITILVNNAAFTAPGRPPAPGATARTEFASVSPDDEFGRAVVELAVADPTVVTGRTIGHLDVLDGSFRPFTDIASALG